LKAKRGMMMRKIVVIVIAAVLLSGCAHVISEDVLKKVNTDINFAELRKKPMVYQGKMVLLGGVS
jgi:outer membrane lipoprotein